MLSLQTCNISSEAQLFAADEILRLRTQVDTFTQERIRMIVLIAQHFAKQGKEEDVAAALREMSPTATPTRSRGA